MSSNNNEIEICQCKNSRLSLFVNILLYLGSNLEVHLSYLQPKHTSILPPHLAISSKHHKPSKTISQEEQNNQTAKHILMASNRAASSADERTPLRAASPSRKEKRNSTAHPHTKKHVYDRIQRDANASLVSISPAPTFAQSSSTLQHLEPRPTMSSLPLPSPGDGWDDEQRWICMRTRGRRVFVWSLLIFLLVSILAVAAILIWRSKWGDGL